jgi:hypothetical protein
MCETQPSGEGGVSLPFGGSGYGTVAICQKTIKSDLIKIILDNRHHFDIMHSAAAVKRS